MRCFHSIFSIAHCAKIVKLNFLDSFKILPDQFVGQKLQVDGLAVSHPGPDALIDFAVVWVEVKLADDVVHASSGWDGVVGGAGVGDED